MLIVEVAAAGSERRGRGAPRGRAQSGFCRRGERTKQITPQFLVFVLLPLIKSNVCPRSFTRVHPYNNCQLRPAFHARRRATVNQVTGGEIKPPSNSVLPISLETRKTPNNLQTTNASL